jgi:hypothetical protein
LSAARTQTFPATERIRLALSYQRYAFLLAVVTGFVATIALVYLPWYLAIIAALVCLKLASATVFITSKLPRKMRATALADRRIARGNFHPRRVQPYCADPCFRVVADEILRRAGYGFRERRSLLRELTAAAEADARAVVFVDHKQGTVVRMGGTVPAITICPPQQHEGQG